MRWMLRSKIHKATVTDANLLYEGSITIDQELIERVGLLPGEKVLVVSNTSGARLETYVIAGERGSGVICINGAAAHLIKKGISRPPACSRMSFAVMTDVVPDSRNGIPEQ